VLLAVADLAAGAVLRVRRGGPSPRLSRAPRSAVRGSARLGAPL